MNTYCTYTAEQALALKRDLTATESLLLDLIRANDPYGSGTAKLDTAQLAEQLQRHRRTIQRALKRLINLGLIAVNAVGRCIQNLRPQQAAAQPQKAQTPTEDPAPQAEDPKFVEHIRQYLNQTRQAHGDSRPATTKDAERYISKRKSRNCKPADAERLAELRAEYNRAQATLPTVDQLNLPPKPSDPRPAETVAGSIGRLVAKFRLGRYRNDALAEAERLGIKDQVLEIVNTSPPNEAAD